ncbi:hypothetical protein F5Y16DRAFT_367249 [Xylariaceae sp. FL0255]|nr:hypothetical protein F5Y16DRAFT_367249 [Xylariaceae sp. FL0255]
MYRILPSLIILRCFFLLTCPSWHIDPDRGTEKARKGKRKGRGTHYILVNARGRPHGYQGIKVQECSIGGGTAERSILLPHSMSCCCSCAACRGLSCTE